LYHPPILIFLIPEQLCGTFRHTVCNEDSDEGFTVSKCGSGGVICLIGEKWAVLRLGSYPCCIRLLWRCGDGHGRAVGLGWVGSGWCAII